MPTVPITPTLAYVEDETGHDLVMLELVDSTGVFTWDGAGLARTDPAKKGRGVQKATGITAVFHWWGSVCCIQSDWDLYCDTSCQRRDLCCSDLSDPPDGIYDTCSDPVCEEGIGCSCPDGSEPVEAQCRTYDDTWVFNIADFVGYLWELDTTGSYVIQVRFHPLQRVGGTPRNA